MTAGDAVTILGPAEPKLRGAMCNFNIKGMNPHDLAIFLEEESNILVRSGILCAHSWFLDRNSSGVVSVLFYIYNTESEVEQLVAQIETLVDDLE